MYVVLSCGMRYFFIDTSYVRFQLQVNCRYGQKLNAVLMKLCVYFSYKISCTCIHLFLRGNTPAERQDRT